MKQHFAIALLLCGLAALVIGPVGCQRLSKGNLPGIRVEVPVYPEATVGQATKEKAVSTGSGTGYTIHSVMIHTDASPEAVLAFYIGTLSGVQIVDFGAYFAIVLRPPGWKPGNRIEIQVPKNPEVDPDGYEVRQFIRTK